MRRVRTTCRCQIVMEIMKILHISLVLSTTTMGEAKACFRQEFQETWTSSEDVLPVEYGIFSAGL